MEKNTLYDLLARAGKDSAQLSVFVRMRRLLKLTRDLNERERARLRQEMARIPGLMTLLMKPRNGEGWSAEERAMLRQKLRGLGTVGLYIGSLATPGTLFTLPLLAWWLDRRAERRRRLSANTVDTEPTTPTR